VAGHDDAAGWGAVIRDDGPDNGSMPGSCGICDQQTVERTNPDGNYKGACAACQNADRERTRHVDNCEDDDCIVCASYRAEFGPI